MSDIKSMMNMAGKSVAITGGAGHLGRSFSHALAELGAEIILIDYPNKNSEKLISELKDKWGISVRYFDCNLESEVERNELITSLNDLTTLDVLINNAAFVGTSDIQGWAVKFDEQTVDSWKRAIEVNLTAVFHLTKGLKDKLAQNSNGSIVNISSIYGLVGPDIRMYESTSMENPAAYGVSKGGIIQYTRWLSTVLAPHVRVNAISPGGIFRNQAPLFVERYIDKCPLNRMAEECDFNGAVAYLASDLSRYVTGQNLIVDGGWTAW